MEEEQSCRIYGILKKSTVKFRHLDEADNDKCFTSIDTVNSAEFYKIINTYQL